MKQVSAHDVATFFKTSQRASTAFLTLFALRSELVRRMVSHGERPQIEATPLAISPIAHAGSIPAA